MIPFEKLGLASSVAKAWDFSWEKTIELASRSNFSQIQLYLSEQHLRPSTVSLLKNVQLKFTLHLHLPPSLSPEKWNDFLLLLHKNIDSKIYLIQHQPFWDDLNQLLKNLPSENFVSGIENDLPNQWPLNFLHWFLVKVKSHVPKALTVIDVPRFFHQAAPEADFTEIAAQIVELIRQLQQMNQHFILHAIDHPKGKTDRPFWQPLLQGELPWPEILNLVKLKPDLLKCLMLEYENWDMVQDSIQTLKKLKL